MNQLGQSEVNIRQRWGHLRREGEATPWLAVQAMGGMLGGRDTVSNTVKTALADTPRVSACRTRHSRAGTERRSPREGCSGQSPSPWGILAPLQLCGVTGHRRAVWLKSGHPSLPRRASVGFASSCTCMGPSGPWILHSSSANWQLVSLF